MQSYDTSPLYLLSEIVRLRDVGKDLRGDSVSYYVRLGEKCNRGMTTFEECELAPFQSEKSLPWS